MIEFTFPSDSKASYNGVPLAGLACTGGMPFVDRRGPYLCLMVHFANPGVHVCNEQMDVVVPALIDPDLARIATGVILASFGVSSTNGIGMPSQPGFQDMTSLVDFLNMAIVPLDTALHHCSIGCDSLFLHEQLHDFALVDHPKHGVMGVTLLEYLALGAPDIRR